MTHCSECGLPFRRAVLLYRKRRGTPDSLPCIDCREFKAGQRRARMAELVIVKRLPVKGAAFELGLGVKNAENIWADVLERITIGTQRLMKGVELRI